MQRLLSGALKFGNHVFRGKRYLFETLEKGQKPSALFITCADSRICPTLITQTDPGDLFVIRNAGNIVPPASAAGGEAATIEYAINALGIRDIIVCGHSHCGAMAGALDHPDGIEGLPFLSGWLRNVAAARGIVLAEYANAPREQQLDILSEANVLLQIEHLSTHPVVARALANDELDIHGWMYRFETGAISSFDLNTGKFRPISDLLQELPEDGSSLPGLAADMRRSPIIRAMQKL